MSNLWSTPRTWAQRAGSVTALLLWINIIVFAVQLLSSVFHLRQFESLFTLNAAGIARGFLWQPFTYMFLHGGLWHLLVNMFVLWFFGREVESFIGSLAFTRLYLFGGLAGAALWLAFNFHSATPVLGASGAVLACVIAFATLFPEREVTLLVFFILPVTLKAKYLALIAIALDAIPLLDGSVTNIAHLAHLGGAGFGWFYIKSLGYGTMPSWTFQLPWRRPGKAIPSRSTDSFISEEIDPILDKISRDGIHSLTARERKVLESARDLLQKH